MNILARILSHGFAIAVVAILAVGYIYRGELFPGMELPAFLYPPESTQSGAGETPGATTAEVAPEGSVTESVEEAPDIQDMSGTPEYQVTEAEEGIPAPAEVRTEGTDTGSTVPAIQPARELQPPPVSAGGITQVPGMPDVAGPAQEAEEIPPPVSGETGVQTSLVPEEAGEQPSMVPAEEAGEQLPVVEEEPPVASPVEEVPSPGSMPPEMLTGEGEMPAETAEPQAAAGDIPAPGPEITGETTGMPATAGTGGGDAYHLLAAAREAFWMHDYDEAEANYLKLIELEPDNPDGYGELGNMYFTQGKWDAAATAYFRAGTNLVSSGHIQQAELLVQVIRGLDGNQADELDKLIAARR